MALGTIRFRGVRTDCKKCHYTSFFNTRFVDVLCLCYAYLGAVKTWLWGGDNAWGQFGEYREVSGDTKNGIMQSMR